MAQHLDDDEPDLEPCYRHPSRTTALHCASCERPICVDCSVHAAVGVKCPECGRLPRAALGRVPTHRVVLASAVAFALSAVLGYALVTIGPNFFGIILAYLAGLGVGRAARAAAGGFRDPQLGRIAGAAAFTGIALIPVARLLVAGAGAESAVRFIFIAVGGVAAAFAANQQVS